MVASRRKPYGFLADREIGASPLKYGCEGLLLLLVV